MPPRLVEASKRAVSSLLAADRASDLRCQRFAREPIRTPADGADTGRGRQSLIDQEAISYQHADTSLCFFPDTVGDDDYAPFRINAAGVVELSKRFG